jgi:hypothetical protein
LTPVPAWRLLATGAGTPLAILRIAGANFQLALYLQPDPFGGAPVLRDTQDAGAKATASLNRYAMPGMSTFTTLGSVPGSRQGLPDFIVEMSLTTANKTIGYLTEEYGTPAALSSLGLSNFGKKIARDYFVRLRISCPDVSPRRWISDSWFQTFVSGKTYVEVGTGNVFPVDEVFPGATVTELPWQRIGSSQTAKWFRKGVLDNALPFAVDFFWQLGTDWETGMPMDYRIGRASAAGIVGIAAGKFVVTPIAGYVAGTVLGAATTPVWLTIGVGIVVGITVERLATNLINDVLFPVK